MSGEATTIARPYAEAVFSQAKESGKLDLWADMLDFIVGVITDPQIGPRIEDHSWSRQQMTDLLLEICGGRLNDEAQNLVRLLAVNDRLPVVPEVQRLFLQLKAEQEGVMDVEITSAFDLKPAQEKSLAQALSKSLGREVRITSATDPALIGGVRIQAGDVVIDGSVAGQIARLANELGN